MPTRQQEARRAVRKFWVAGAAGAFLSGLSRTFPADFAARAWPPDWGYTLDLLLRYGYMFWFLAYFAISSFSTDHSFDTEANTKYDVTFDVLQSSAALLAVFYLGFVTRGKPDNPGLEYLCANGVILLLSFLSWFFFSVLGQRSGSWWLSRISVLRELGMLFSSLGILLALLFANSLRTQSRYIYGWFIVLQVALWCVLGRYWWIRWSHPINEADNFEKDMITIFCKF